VMLGAVVPSLASPSQPTTSPSGPSGANTVTVLGNGTVTAPPDEAVLSLGVRTEASSANDALKENATRMTAVIKALHGLGISDADIATVSVSLNPRYSHGSISGYTAENDISVTVHDLSRVGRAIDAAVAAGANVANGVTFQLSDPNQGVTDALKQAVANARAKAQALASAAGANLGSVVSMTESTAQPPVEYAVPAPAYTPINPGPVQVQVSVTVVWTLQ
jgi:uncharacterized protein